MVFQRIILMLVCSPEDNLNTGYPAVSSNTSGRIPEIPPCGWLSTPPFLAGTERVGACCWLHGLNETVTKHKGQVGYVGLLLSQVGMNLKHKTTNDYSICFPFASFKISQPSIVWTHSLHHSHLKPIPVPKLTGSDLLGYEIAMAPYPLTVVFTATSTHQFMVQEVIVKTP